MLSFNLICNNAFLSVRSSRLLSHCSLRNPQICQKSKLFMVSGKKKPIISWKAVGKDWPTRLLQHLKAHVGGKLWHADLSYFLSRASRLLITFHTAVSSTVDHAVVVRSLSYNSFSYLLAHSIVIHHTYWIIKPASSCILCLNTAPTPWR